MKGEGAWVHRPGWVITARLLLQVICQVSLAQLSDVDKAVAAAKDAFENGLWGKISARDRGRLLYR